MAAPGFPSLCQELSRIQIQMLQRQGSASALGAEAVRLIHSNVNCIQASNENAPFVPLYLRTCASLFQHSPPSLNLAAYHVLQVTSEVARQYVGGRLGDVNDSSSVLRSVLGLERCHSAITGALEDSGETPRSADEASHEVNPYSWVVQPAFTCAYQKWHQQQVKPTTLSVLSLIDGTSAVYGRSMHFTPASHDMRALLPCKSSVLMEAKKQRCFGARELLASLREMEFNRLDAGMCLNTMAECGFYDEEVCNRSCAVLHTTHALVSSQQFCDVLHSLGVMQHRHVHVKFFSSLVNPKKCDAQGVLRQVRGLAMLQQPPPVQRQLMDGLFLHALRSAPKRGQGEQQQQQHRRRQRQQNEHELPQQWYIDAAHALSCLGIHQAKFKLMAARHARRGISRLTTQEMCKTLYGLGGIPRGSVPEELQRAWESQVERVKSILFKRLEGEVSPEDGPQIVNALHYCGVKEHPSISTMPGLSTSRAENPADVILRTWSRTSKECIMELTEQIEPHHLRSDQPAKVAQVVTRVADTCGRADSQSVGRFSPLVAAVDASGAKMSTDEVMGTIGALQRLELSGHYQPSIEALVVTLWQRREDMTDAQLEVFRGLADNLRDIRNASELLGYSLDRAHHSTSGH